MQEYYTIVGTKGIYTVDDKPVEFATREDGEKTLELLDRNIWLEVAVNKRPVESDGGV